MRNWKTYLALALACGGMLAAVTTCAENAALVTVAEDNLAAAQTAHEAELARVRSQAFNDAVALAARTQAQVVSESEAWEKGFSLGSARCGL